VLGVFDSGLGGLTVLRQLRRRLPDQDIAYLADQAHVPYGDRSPAELLEFLRDNLTYLDEQRVAAIVVACNTSCAVAMSHGWPASKAPILNLIESAAEEVSRRGARRVGVVATTVTASSGAYGDALRARIPGVVVEEVAAPALVPLVEAGRYHGPSVRAAVEEACAPLSRDIDALVYGCTHYPILDAYFAAIMGEGVDRIDPAIAQADAAERLVTQLGIAPGGGVTTYATTGDPLAFAPAVHALLAEAHPRVIGVGHLVAVRTRIGNV
jgi:glutamate racemase